MATSNAQASGPRLLWNAENIRDVAESVGIPTLGDEALRTLTQDVEYRIGQVLIEALRIMRASRRTTLTTQDVTTALRALSAEPLYGYQSTRPPRYREASLGPGQPLYYVEDEEVDFEKLINAPLPKIPRDVSFTAHWLAVDGVQPTIPQNPSTAESRSQELVAKGPGANPALAALTGNDNVAFRPAVRHIISKELILYFDKIQSVLLDDSQDEEVFRLRRAALASVRDDPGLHQLVPYFVNFIANQVTHHLDDTFVLRQMMELTSSLIDNRSLFLDAYASPLSAPVLTCLMARRVGPEDAGAVGLHEQYRLREFAASLVGRIASRYAQSNGLLRPKLTRTCLRYFLDPTRPPAVLYGAVSGLAAAGGPESVRVLLVRNLRSVDAGILQPLRERKESKLEYEMLVGAIVKAVVSMEGVGGVPQEPTANGVDDTGISKAEAQELADFVGPIIAERIEHLGNRDLTKQVLEARQIE